MQSWLGLWNTPSTPLHRDKILEGEVPLMLDFWEFGVPLHCHRSPVNSSPEWQDLTRFHLWVK